MKNIAKIVIIIALILSAIFLLTNKGTSIEVSFENNSGETTTDFFIYFRNDTTPQSVPNISPNATFVMANAPLYTFEPFDT